MAALFNLLAARPRRSLVALGLLLLLAGNWLLPLTDRDEARFGEASREMIQRGDYIVPWFNGAWRFDKPVLIYWCQIAGYRALGVNDFAARLPSALFTTATALVLLRWGRRNVRDSVRDSWNSSLRKSRDEIRNPKSETGFIAGAMYLTALHLALLGRMATADMAMIFFVTLAAWSGWELTRPEQAQRKKFWFIFYVALALGFLAKGPVAWLPLAGLGLGRFWRRESFRLPLGETLPGLGLTLALVAAWGVPALLQTGGKFWSVGMGEHVFHRSLGVINGHGPKDTLQYFALLPLYFVTFFASFFPWSLRVPGTLKRWWPERRRDDLGWYLLVNAAVVFIVFSLVKTKLFHYTLPAFPLIALWLARQIAGETSLPVWFTRRLVAMTALTLALTLGGFSLARGHLLTLNLWRAARPYTRAETKVGCFGYTEPSLVWHFRSVTTNYLTLGDVKQARDFLTNAPPFILVLPTAQLGSLPDTNGLRLDVHGLDLVKFRQLGLTALVHPGADAREESGGR